MTDVTVQIDEKRRRTGKQRSRSTVTTRSDAEIAADIKRRLLEAFRPSLEIFDEASAAGLAIQWDSISPVAPRYKHEILGLRIVKYL